MAKKQKKRPLRLGETVQTGRAAQPNPVGSGAGAQGRFVQGRDASEIEEAIIEAIKLQMIGTGPSAQLFVTPEGKGGMNAEQFIKQNPDFRPGNQPDLDQFQGAGFFPDFALPVEGDVAPTTTTVPGALPQQLPQRASGGAVPSVGQDNPFGGLRLPTDFLTQQFATGGQARTAFGNPVGGLQNVAGGERQTGATNVSPFAGFSSSGGAGATPGSGGGGGGGGTVGGSGANATTNIASSQPAGGGGGGGTNIGNFNPLEGSAGDKLQDTIQTGNPTDTGALAQSTADVNRLAFDQALGSQNEQLGALGLGSSSTRSGQNQQLLNDFQLQTANQNNQLAFGAQENAANRSLQAFNPFLAGSQQTLSGGIAQGQQDVANRGITSGENIAQAGINSQQLQQLRGFDQSNASQLSDQNFQTNLFNAGTGFASGGPVNREDFISNAAFGQTFDRPRAEFQSRGGPGSRQSTGLGQSFARPQHDSGAASRAATTQDAQNDILQQQLLAIRRANMNVGRGTRQVNDKAKASFLGSALGRSAANSRVPISEVADITGLLGLDRSHQGLMQTGQLIGQAGQAVAAANSPHRQTGGQVPAPQLGGGPAPQQSPLGEQAPPQSAPNTQQRPQQPPNPQFADGGDVLQSAPGTIPGPSVPPDQVPILASGGEGIVPPDVMGALDDPASQTPEGAMEIVQMLRDIMNFAPGPRGPEDQGGRGAGEPASRNAEIPRGAAGMRVPTGPPEGVGQRPDTAGPGVQRRSQTFPQGGQVIPNSGFDPNQDFQSAGGLPPAGPNSLAGFGNTFGNSDLAGVGGSDPLEFAPRDFNTEIQNAQASVDNMLALALKDGNRNTRLRAELLPQAQQRLDQLKIEADQAAQIANQQLNAQGQADSGAAQLLNAQEGTERTQIAADAQVEAAGARNSLFGGVGGVSPVDIVAPEFTPAPTIEQDLQAARGGDPAAIARMLQARVMTEPEWLAIQEQNPQLAQAVLQEMATMAGQQAQVPATPDTRP